MPKHPPQDQLPEQNQPAADALRDTGSVSPQKSGAGPSAAPSSAKASQASSKSANTARPAAAAGCRTGSASSRPRRAQVSGMTDAELAALRHSLRKYVKGKPTHYYNPVSIPSVLGHAVGLTIKSVCILLVLTVFLLGGLGMGTIFGYIATTKPLPSDLLKAGSQTSYVYDIEGNVMAKFTGSNNVDRVYVPYNNVRDTYIDDAFIAIEDERFETNIGIDPKRILSAVISALSNGGEATHGGSTITQQTVKLITGDDQPSAQRKVQEWYKAIMLNQQLTKWEIMELYLNLVPMSNSYVGIETAAKAYFGKSASELNLPECAFLAGLPKSPSIYNPLTERGRRNAMRRQRIVLGKMHQLGKITDEEYHDALNSELVFKEDTTPSAATEINSYFTEYAVRVAIQDLQKRNGYSEELARQIITGGGVKIYTTMEPYVQNALDNTFKKPELFAVDYEDQINQPEFPQAGMAVINNATGAIAGLQGGYGEKNANLVLNRATDIQRQTGSVTKPINIYAPGMEMYKVTGATILDDKKVYLNPDEPDEPYPKNSYYPEYRGKMTLRNAVKISNNVPAAEVLLMIGIDNSKYFMNEVGIDRMNDQAGIAIATGSYGTGMSPLEIASAFSVFPNGGQYSNAYPYTRVEDSQGAVLLENNVEFKQVYRPSVAYMMARVMEETLARRYNNFPYAGSAYGYGNITNELGESIDTAGKTGTTDEDVDKWFTAFTPYYTGAVWYGYDNRIKKQSVNSANGQGAIRIWYDAMQQIHAGKPPAQWDRPGNIIDLKICIQSGKLATSNCGSGNTITEYFEKDSPLTPAAVCHIHGGSALTPYGNAAYVPPPTQAATAPETTAAPSSAAPSTAPSSSSEPPISDIPLNPTTPSAPAPVPTDPPAPTSPPSS